MGTKVLKKLKQKAHARPPILAGRLRKYAWVVIAVFLALALPAIALIVLKIWVPGMAWL